jgi:class 3 adenylate cyclase
MGAEEARWGSAAAAGGEAAGTAYALHPLTLRFRPALERRFWEAQRPALLWALRVTFLFGTLGLLVTAPLGRATSLQGPPVSYWAPQLARAAFPALLLALTFARPFSAAGLIRLAVAGYLVSGLALAARLATEGVGPAGGGAYAMFGLLTLFALHTLTRLPFVAATPLAAVYVGLWAVVMRVAPGAQPGVVGVYTLFLLLGWVVAGGAGYLLERASKQAWAQAELAERLLLNILPAPIAERLKREPGVIADACEITVLFADIVGFTPLTARVPPDRMVRWLNGVFAAFDRLAERHGLEKIRTIGDSYMVVGGVPLPRPDHAEAVAELALDLLEEVAGIATPLGEPLRVRVGIDSGPAIAAVMGVRKFIYDVYGDAVNTASRMESHGLPGAIQVTAAVYARLRDRYAFAERGEIEVKGKGQLRAFVLTGRRADGGTGPDGAVGYRGASPVEEGNRRGATSARVAGNGDGPGAR